MSDWLWLDDLRAPPDSYRYWAKTYDEAVYYLETCNIEHCSLDHDLADEHYKSNDRTSYRERTGYDVLLWMAETGKWCPDITIHTMNIVGRMDMVRLLDRHAPEHIAWRTIFAPIEPAEHEGES